MKGLHVTDLLCCGLIDVHTEIFILNNSYETVVFGHLLDDSVRECYLKEIISFTWYDKNELCINLKWILNNNLCIHCGFYCSDMGCTCSPMDKWYSCPLEPEPMFEDVVRTEELSQMQKRNKWIPGQAPMGTAPLKTASRMGYTLHHSPAPKNGHKPVKSWVKVFKGNDAPCPNGMLSGILWRNPESVSRCPGSIP